LITSSTTTVDSATVSIISPFQPLIDLSSDIYF
jgi:hypothetical protein